jgi:hypothetical protein
MIFYDITLWYLEQVRVKEASIPLFETGSYLSQGKSGSAVQVRFSILIVDLLPALSNILIILRLERTGRDEGYIAQPLWNVRDDQIQSR